MTLALSTTRRKLRNASSPSCMSSRKHRSSLRGGGAATGQHGAIKLAFLTRCQYIEASHCILHSGQWPGGQHALQQRGGRA